jgi:hypothetical protein
VRYGIPFLDLLVKLELTSYFSHDRFEEEQVFLVGSNTDLVCLRLLRASSINAHVETEDLHFFFFVPKRNLLLLLPVHAENAEVVVIENGIDVSTGQVPNLINRRAFLSLL